MRFICIRHCQTDWNVLHRLQGQADIELNRNGRRQAEVLVEKLTTHNPTLIISSDLKRAAETARIIATGLGIEIQHDTRLRECSFGAFEGKTWNEIEESLGIKKADVWRGAEYSYDFTPYQGESRDEVLRRHLSLLDDISRFEHACIVIVGHGTGLGTLLSSLGDTTSLGHGDIRVIQYPANQ